MCMDQENVFKETYSNVFVHIRIIFVHIRTYSYIFVRIRTEDLVVLDGYDQTGQISCRQHVTRSQRSLCDTVHLNRSDSPHNSEIGHYVSLSDSLVCLAFFVAAVPALLFSCDSLSPKITIRSPPTHTTLIPSLILNHSN